MEDIRVEVEERKQQEEEERRKFVQEVQVRIRTFTL